MKTIAIIDDLLDAREELEDIVSDVLNNENYDQEWGVLSSAPLKELSDYGGFIETHNISIMLLDERLGDVPNDDGEIVLYKGSMLADYLRKHYPQMPIYGVTAYPEDASLQEYFAQFDEVIRRDDFAFKASAYIPRFIRADQNLLKAQDKIIGEMGQLSTKIALGTADDNDMRRAKEIQQKLSITIPVNGLKSRKAWLDQYKIILDDYENVQREAQAYINDVTNQNKDTK